MDNSFQSYFEQLELENLGAGDKRAVDREEGILRGRPDKTHRSPLDIGKKGILLRFVEAVDLVDKKKCASAVPRLDGGRSDCLADVGHGSLDAAQLDEAALRPGGDEPGQACLSRAGRAVEDDRGEAVGLDGTAQ